MKFNKEQGEHKIVARRSSKTRKFLAGLSLAATATAGSLAPDVLADALTGVMSINDPADSANLKPAVRLNPPKKSGLGNRKVYWIGDSLTVGISQTDTKEYAASLGFDITYNAISSRGLYMGCDLPSRGATCSRLSDGFTELKNNVGDAAVSCIFLYYMGANAYESNGVYSQKYVESHQIVAAARAADPAQTCPVNQSIFVGVTVPYGPNAPTSYKNQMIERKQILVDDVDTLPGAFVIDLQSHIIAINGLGGSVDGVHGAAKVSGYFIVDQLSGIANSLN